MCTLEWLNYLTFFIKSICIQIWYIVTNKWISVTKLSESVSKRNIKFFWSFEGCRQIFKVLKHTFQQQHICVILPKVKQSAFTQAFFSSQSDVHEYLGGLKYLWWDLTDRLPAVNHYMAHQQYLLWIWHHFVIVTLQQHYSNTSVEAIWQCQAFEAGGTHNFVVPYHPPPSTPI